MKHLVIVAVALLFTGCASTHQVARDLTVMNDPGNFTLHIGSVENFSHRMEYRWENPAAKATVRQASSVAGGEATLEVRDAAGRLVHSKSLREQGSFATSEGKPGTWRIGVTLRRTTGSVTFEVRRNG
ncbi:MAG TPA: hypothetical protein VFT93_00465 [Candidatus Eisenbacteria bacterium]|nr:hypothetical protein [Candidatus Eisenbacteria bacterium]